MLATKIGQFGFLTGINNAAPYLAGAGEKLQQGIAVLPADRLLKH